MRPIGGTSGRPKLEGPIRYGISDRRLFPALDPESYLDLLLATSATVIQLREKALDPARLGRLTESGVRSARRRGKLFVVNSDVRVAVEKAAHGVHLTRAGDPESARRYADAAGRPDLLVGWSVHDLAGVREAERRGVDYVLLAPVFSPISKPGREPLGLGALRKACANSSLPVIALGGITPARVESVLDAGAAGFAGISWVANEIRVSVERTRGEV